MQEISFSTNNNKYSGILIKEDKDYITVKLNSGYNVNFKKTNLKQIKKGKKIPKKTQKAKPRKAEYIVLHTGGTIASKVDYNTGSVIAQTNPDELLESIPELKQIGKFGSELISNIMSESMYFKHYNIIAESIQKHIKNGIKGIIIGHGTDFMHYTSAALSFMLENLPIPVILVGSQRSSDRGSSDAAINLICAAHYIKKASPGVYVCMHNSTNDYECGIIEGVRARKMHTSRRDAFQSINASPIATVTYPSGKIKQHRKIITTKGKFEIKKFKELKIGILRTRPNMYSEEIKQYNKFDGLVIEGSGIGNAPVMSFDTASQEAEKINYEIKKLKIPIALTSQAINGRINMDVYSVSRRLKQAGVLGNQCDMTTETAYIKLAWLISNYPNKIKELYGKNLRGEISEISKQRDYNGL